MKAKYYREEPDRDPEEITDVLGAIIERVGTGAGRSTAALVDEWDEVVPERWRGASRPIGIRDGVLLVEVQDGTAASLLRHDTADLLRVISSRFGPGLAKGVRLRVSRAQQDTKTL